MVALQIFLTLLILSSAVFVAMVHVSENIYADKPDPDWLKIVGGLAAGGAFLSLVASLVSVVWVVL